LFNGLCIAFVGLQFCYPTTINLYGMKILTDSVRSEKQSLTVCFCVECVILLSVCLSVSHYEVYYGRYFLP
jgi:hypothetical protein